MEEDIENALNNLWNSLDDESFNLTYSQEQMQEDLRLILNRYNYLDSKAENLINKNKELETIIKLMTKDITLGIFDESMCRAMVDDDFWCEFSEKDKCEKCTLEYYKKKAKGE